MGGGNSNLMNLLNIKIPTLEEERQRLLELISNEFDKNEGSFFYDIFSVVALSNISLIEQLANAWTNSFGLTAKGEYLDYKANEVGLERKQGKKANGIVTFVGKQGTVIAHNTVVLCDNLEFITLYDTEINSSGRVRSKVEAVEIGSKYNVRANTINRLGVTISGVTSVTNEQPFSNGLDTETDEELRIRYLQKVQEPATSGNAYHFKKWALEIEEVGAVKVYPLWNGAGTVKVVVISKNGTVLNTQQLEKVKKHIDTLRPIGADVTVENAVIKQLNISATIIKESNSNIESIKNDFINSVNNYLKTVNIENTAVSYGKITNILYNTLNVIDFNNLTLNNLHDNVTLLENEIVVLSEVQFNE